MFNNGIIYSASVSYALNGLEVCLINLTSSSNEFQW